MISTNVPEKQAESTTFLPSIWKQHIPLKQWRLTIKLHTYQKVSVKN